MIYISHRGNVEGKNEVRENSPYYIMEAIVMGFDVEVDVWVIDGVIFLGHDAPQYSVDFRWFRDRISKLWIHCKNIEAIVYFKESGYDMNYFWHDTDTLTITSNGYLWVYPGKQPIKGSIAVMPEIHNDDISNCIGICSDFIQNYKK